MSARALPSSSSTSSICTRCIHRLQWAQQSRNTSTASSSPQPQKQTSGIPPESPNFIHVPAPVQAPNYEPPKPVKGVLPVSRNIFSRNREYRSTSAYKSRVTPEPNPRPLPHGTEAERVQYARELSFVRRQTLREGISEIWAKREQRAERQGRASGLKKLGNVRAAKADARPDEVLTVPSLHPSARLLLAAGNVPGPRSTAPSKYPTVQARRSAARKQALHNLYVNAQHFIVNETQLNEEIEKVFGSDEMPVRWNETNGVWGLKEKPRTAGEMLGGEMDGVGRDVDKIAGERMKRIAETLTGGRMSEIGRQRRV